VGENGRLCRPFSPEDLFLRDCRAPRGNLVEK
jgi:hypothetical protein